MRIAAPREFLYNGLIKLSTFEKVSGNFLKKKKNETFLAFLSLYCFVTGIDTNETDSTQHFLFAVSVFQLTYIRRRKKRK